MATTHQPSHKYTQSTDSEISCFESSSTASTTDSWSGYFEGWAGPTRDSYCPQIASTNNSPTRPKHESLEPDLLPTACPRPRRPSSVRKDASLQIDQRRLRDIPSKTRRYGIVPYASPTPGEAAAAQLDSLLHNAMSNTEDLLAAMYSSDWDAASLQKWYQNSSQGPADLALLKIMFSLRYTLDEPSPLG